MNKQMFHTIENFMFGQQNFTKDPATHLFMHPCTAQSASADMFLRYYI